MGWISFRIALAHLLPGFIPTTVLFIVLGETLRRKFGTTLIDFSVFYFLSSITLGIAIDLIRHRFERYFINWFNLSWLTYFLHFLLSKVGLKTAQGLPLKFKFERYNEKEREAIKLWLALRLESHKEVSEKLTTPILQKEFYNPTITIGDRWVILNILDKEGLKFFLEEYFSYYEFSFNVMFSMFLTFIVGLYIYHLNLITYQQLKIITMGCIVGFIIFQEAAIFWLLASKRFARKLILYSLIR